MPRYPLMLATPGGHRLPKDPIQAVAVLMQEGGWTFEFKYDGVRCLVESTPDGVRLVNRSRRDITFRYPDVVSRLGVLPDVVLDGEIVCLDERGRPDFHRIHHRDAQQSARAAGQLAQTVPAQFVAFDVLVSGGVDLRLRPYLDRRQDLVDLGPALTAAGMVVPPVSEDGRAMWAVVEDMRLEGLIAKRNDGRYVGRRSPHWLKLKRTHTVSALVSGYDQGEGSRASTFGALQLSLLDAAGALVSVGSVGSGFSAADIDLVWRRLQAGDHPIVVEVEYLEVSPSGHLRQPTFRGVRTDVDPHSCTLTSLSE